MAEMIHISKKEYEEMKATIETLQDQEVLKQIAMSEKEILEGKTHRWKDVRDKI
ncbi:MAG: hypothetical protein JW778_02545 [Candidatus Altiarchaeota archaeon]|nr:hypothetical protein [Candidatus Altiarchaeota archaeon]